MLTIKELLSLTSGAVVELDCLAADPLEILANGKLVARGEVVLVGDNYGLKITEIVKPWLGS
jgi:flagellar motor switch protein FliN/FliY